MLHWLSENGWNLLAGLCLLVGVAWLVWAVCTYDDIGRK